MIEIFFFEFLFFGSVTHETCTLISQLVIIAFVDNIYMYLYLMYLQYQQ